MQPERQLSAFTSESGIGIRGSSWGTDEGSCEEKSYLLSEFSPQEAQIFTQGRPKGPPLEYNFWHMSDSNFSIFSDSNFSRILLEIKMAINRKFINGSMPKV